MIIGVLKETKANENRVAITPYGVEILRHHGHEVLIQESAGIASGFRNDHYEQLGGQIQPEPESIFARADMILRVKSPEPFEYGLLREGQIYFSYLHLAASGSLTRALMKSGAVCIAYETIQRADGSLPLLIPMSEVAGPMAIQEGAKYLEKAQGGHGILLGGVPGVEPGAVLILGGGVVGITAAKIACGLGARVFLLEIKPLRLRYLSDVMPANCFIHMSSPAAVRELLPKADLVVGAVLEPAQKTPILVTRDMLADMKPGSVVVDVSVDQGGCFETSRETTHADPIYTVDGIIHYGVSNMPGALPRTATMALTNASLPYALEIANKGWRRAMAENMEIRLGANAVLGNLTRPGIARTLDIPYVPIDSLL